MLIDWDATAPDSRSWDVAYAAQSRSMQSEDQTDYLIRQAVGVKWPALMPVRKAVHSAEV